jgi:uncharacterized RDD family membrane protein YckC
MIKNKYMNKEFEVTDDILATQQQRFANYIIDFIVQYILVFAITAIVIIACNYFEIYGFGIWLESAGRVEEYLIGAVIAIFYYSILEILLSKSIGKFITKTIVVDEFGNKVRPEIIIKRTFCRLIPFNHFSFLGGNNRGWHDTISDTYVVKEQLLKEAKKQFYEFDEIGKSEE